MHRKHLIAILAIASTLSVAAQTLSNGFYRVQNYGTERYAYVYDNTGSVNISTTSADMGAIVLYRDAARRFADPASVIYINGKGKNGSYDLYDLETQGTGVHKILNYYVSVTKGNVAGTYWVFEPTYNMYLWDGMSSTYHDESYVSTSGTSTKPNLRCWSVFPVNSNTDEYLGITPDASRKIGSKYYHPYYVGFAMDFASTGMKAYYISDVKSDAVIIKEIIGTVPAATPVIVECNASTASSNRVNLYPNSPAKISGNNLVGNYFCYANHGETGYKKYDPTTMRLLSVKDGRLCYVTDSAHELCTPLEFSNGTTSTFRYCIPANSSYLQVPAGTAAELPVMTQAEYDALHPATKKGDINGDGTVDVIDVAYIYRAIAAGTKASAAPQYDIDGNGAIDAIDVAMVYRIIAKES